MGEAKNIYFTCLKKLVPNLYYLCINSFVLKTLKLYSSSIMADSMEIEQSLKNAATAEKSAEEKAKEEEAIRMKMKPEEMTSKDYYFDSYALRLRHRRSPVQGSEDQLVGKRVRIRHVVREEGGYRRASGGRGGSKAGRLQRLFD